jgi:hypothetical protein
VWGAGAFCYGLFVLIYILGSLSMGAPVFPMLLLQHSILQLEMLFILTSLCFLLSILVNLDAAITFGSLFYIVSSTLATLFNMIYESAGAGLRFVVQALTWLLPQFMLFDLSEKNVHGDVWGPIPFRVIAQLTGYALVFSSVYILITLMLFRRRSL